ncbi:DNA-binding transcriptional regulator, MurR/RpiR family, contains HTH and SIS domains [Leucobacter chromiiresistens]|uniref:DNA-binding transcriptional regulator, MurR/RpiR family, contains HTH and SIS domains n=2 Tax=Leucobacter chromiiresistens TaxID=1079994 RepID=A0A1H0Z8F0_9MICO|nr:DNA-binding transcriptional regulator, MurR/RpiR family, contains HTH and SIS domains [Leucobacter chromiiresistens]
MPPATPASALALIRAFAATLGEREGAVARVILERPAEVPQWSTQELAAAAGTSTATVIRACQRLGFRGFQHLRLELAREAPAPLAEQPTPGDTVDHVFESARAALLVGRSSIDRGALADAATLLAEASRVVCAANGFSAPPLQDAAMRLATVGRPVEAPLDILAQQFAAHSLTAGDVCFALSHSGANAHTLATVRAARRRGARVVSLCSYDRGPLADLSDVALSTGAVGTPHAVDPFFSRLGHSVLLQALVTEVAALRASAGADAEDMREVVVDALAEAHP